MARKVIAGILFLASTSTNVFADDCCRQQMVTGLNVFFWATKLKYFAQQIKRIFRLPLFGRSVHPAWGKAFQWFGSTGPRHLPGGEIQPKISFYQKMQRVDVCTHGQARPAMRNTVSQVPPSPFPPSFLLWYLLKQFWCQLNVDFAESPTVAASCRWLYLEALLTVPGEIGLQSLKNRTVCYFVPPNFTKAI